MIENAVAKTHKMPNHRQRERGTEKERQRGRPQLFEQFRLLEIARSLEPRMARPNILTQTNFGRKNYTYTK